MNESGDERVHTEEKQVEEMVEEAVVVLEEVKPINSINRVIFQKRVKDKWLSQRKSAQQKVDAIEEEAEPEIKHESIELEVLKQSEKEEAKLSEEKTEGQSDKQTVAAAPVPKIPLKTRAFNFVKAFSVNPLNNSYYGWLLIISACYVYNMVFLIARAAFWLLEDIEYPVVWLILDYGICDLVYLVDLFVRFSTSFMENGELCTNKIKIAKRYVRSIQFKIDIISTLPTDLVYYLYLKNFDDQLDFGSHSLLPGLRLNRLFKFSRLLEFRYLTETQTKYPTMFRLSSLLLNILIVMHWNACIYFLISHWAKFGSDTWVFPALVTDEQLKNMTDIQRNNILQTNRLHVQYVYCFWWSVQTLSTIAEVPSPTNFQQELYMSVLLMLGVVILAITIGSASEMVENAQRENLELQAKCDFAKSYLKQNKIGSELVGRIKNYLNYLWIAKDVNKADILKALPDNLRKAIAKDVHMETLKRVPVFQDCEPGLLEELVTKLTLQIYSPGDYVCRKGDVGHEMYFIKTGKLQVVSPDGTKVFATLGAGAAFGEISILDIPGNKNGNKRTANIRSLGFSDVYQLSKTDLWSALSEYPVAKKILLEKGKQLLRKDNLLDEAVCERMERKQKPLHEQVEYLQVNCLDQLGKSVDSLLKEYMTFLKETKSNLALIEKQVQ